MKAYPEYKDSEIQWIQEIPIHWNILATKALFDIKSGATPNSNINRFWEGDINWITPADYKTTDHYVENGKRTISQEGYESCSTEIVPEGSLIFSKRAPIGSVAIAKAPLCTNQGCLSCVPKDNISSGYYYYCMSILQNEYEGLGTGSTFKEISLKNFSDFKLPVPPMEDQEKIASYLDGKVGKIDRAIELLQAQIDDLRVYKDSVIREAVTGKIDLREKDD